MKKYRTSEIVAYFTTDVVTVWNIVTNNHDYTWRSDIKIVEVLEGGNSFVEITPNGIKTKFNITNRTLYELYEFNMDNNMLEGNWVGKFTSTENGGTKITFTENIFVKNSVIRLISVLFMNIKKIQNTYIIDLKKKLGEEF